ncbi:hypothetical protein IFM51744_09773 [Aspergillus udagawae]|uniref:Uncharacterized protein n=1 Tax=Aspergillus udagawae TaxID=91492 RepID=A0ABQ1BEX2_9EURO|nr:hypothetical protein IFM51744_09773 [Aspergillus udagawae]GFG00406.1 hypothetical protein IFM53868_10742 [Aspergillus udagawae]
MIWILATSPSSSSSASAKSGNPSIDGLLICGLSTGVLYWWKGPSQVKWDVVGRGGGEEKNSDLDMILPVIDILEGAKARRKFLFGFDGARDDWMEDIEIYAPGYLEMEAAGNEADYDQARLIEPGDAYDIRTRIHQGQVS